jgi:hypothetical protein
LIVESREISYTTTQMVLTLLIGACCGAVIAIAFVTCGGCV